MINPSSSELGDFLRSRREKLSPSALGLAKRRRRRTPGLRREEVAELAGIGVDWYIRLEQGRAARPSVTTVDSLARALRLSKEERAHLRALAERRDRRPFARETAPEPMRRLIESLNQPAYITGRRWDVLAWNAAAAEIFGDFDRFAEKDRNILITMLTEPAARRLFAAGWANEARRMVAQFRASYDVWAGDPAFEELVARLRRESAEFAGWWEAHDIRMAGGGQKLLDTPTMGLVGFDYATFQANDDPALRLAIYRRAERGGL